MNQSDTSYPHLTVATIVENAGLFLIVEETEAGQSVFNQPAGHVECGESMEQAAVRETLEETGWQVGLQALLGTTIFHSPANGVYYCRTTFIARAEKQVHHLPTDPDITAVHWLGVDQLRAESAKMRSPLVLKSIERYLSGVRFPLDYLY